MKLQPLLLGLLLVTAAGRGGLPLRGIDCRRQQVAMMQEDEDDRCDRLTDRL